MRDVLIGVALLSVVCTGCSRGSLRESAGTPDGGAHTSASETVTQDHQPIAPRLAAAITHLERSRNVEFVFEIVASGKVLVTTHGWYDNSTDHWETRSTGKGTSGEDFLTVVKSWDPEIWMNLSIWPASLEDCWVDMSAGRGGAGAFIGSAFVGRRLLSEAPPQGSGNAYLELNDVLALVSGREQLSGESGRIKIPVAVHVADMRIASIEIDGTALDTAVEAAGERLDPDFGPDDLRIRTAGAPARTSSSDRILLTS